EDSAARHGDTSPGRAVDVLPEARSGASTGHPAEDGLEPGAELPRLCEQADHEVRLAREIEEEAGVDQDAILLQQKEYQLLFAANRGDAQDRRPASVGGLDGDRGVAW